MRKNLKTLRRERNLTQTCVASAIGLQLRQYKAIEAGTTNSSLPVWEALRDLLRAPSIDYLLTSDEKAS